MQRLRSIVFMAYFILSILLTSIVAAPIALASDAAARGIAQGWARFTLRALKWITGLGYRLEGAENIPQGGAIVAANHQSQWETIALYALLPKPMMIIKKELLALPVYGWWMKRVGNIAIDRKGGAKALRALRRDAAARIGAGNQIVVFPEGTRGDVGSRLPYQPGVAGIYIETQTPCVPVAHNSGVFWRYPGVEKRSGDITLRFLPAIAPSLNRKEFLRTLQTKIEAARPDLNHIENCDEQSIT